VSALEFHLQPIVFIRFFILVQVKIVVPTKKIGRCHGNITPNDSLALIWLFLYGIEEEELTGGAEEDRIPDLRIANASQLFRPTTTCSHLLI